MDLDVVWNRKLDHSEKDEDPNKEALIHILDNDCLTKIFMYLPFEQRLQMEKVCSRWKDVSFERAWYDMKSLDVNKIRDDLLKKPNFPINAIRWYIEQFLIRGGRYLIDLCLCSPCDFNTLVDISQNCLSLKTLKLDLDDAHIKNECYRVLSNLQTIQSIKINQYSTNGLSKHILESFDEKIKDIHLDYKTGCNRIRSDAKSLFGKFIDLRSLKINDFVLTNGFVEEICQIQTLVHLDLSRCSCNLPESSISNLINLEYLDLRQVNNVDDSIMADIMNCKNLKYLDISFNSRITDHGLWEIAKLENLQNLLINNNSNISDIPFGQSHMEKLEKIELRNCRRITDPGIIELIKNSPNLECLDLIGSFITSETLVSAVDEMNFRQNNKILKLLVNRGLRKFIDVRDMPPCLVIQ